MSKPPIFILGCERSGTTLLQTLLDAHPSIAAPPESNLYPRFADIIEFYGNLNIVANVRALIGDILRDWCIQALGVDFTVEQVVARVQSPNRAGVFRALFDLYAEAKGADRWAEKTTTNLFFLRQILEDFPQAQFVHIVRDGRDVAESLRRMPWGPTTAPSLARYWRRHLEALWEARTLIRRQKLVEIRYEDLVVKTESVLCRVFRFLDESVMDTFTNYDSTDLCRRYTSLRACHSSLRGGITRGSIGAYKERLSGRDIELFEWVAGPTLSECGYARAFANPRPPSLVESAVLRAVESLYWLYLRCVHLRSPRFYGQHVLRALRRRWTWRLRRRIWPGPAGENYAGIAR